VGVYLGVYLGSEKNSLPNDKALTPGAVIKSLHTDLQLLAEKRRKSHN
jgi:hypothetical protein